MIHNISTFSQFNNYISININYYLSDLNKLKIIYHQFNNYRISYKKTKEKVGPMFNIVQRNWNYKIVIDNNTITKSAGINEVKLYEISSLNNINLVSSEFMNIYYNIMNPFKEFDKNFIAYYASLDQIDTKLKDNFFFHCYKYPTQVDKKLEEMPLVIHYLTTHLFSQIFDKYTSQIPLFVNRSNFPTKADTLTDLEDYLELNSYILIKHLTDFIFNNILEISDRTTNFQDYITEQVEDNLMSNIKEIFNKVIISRLNEKYSSYIFANSLKDFSMFLSQTFKNDFFYLDSSLTAEDVTNACQATLNFESSSKIVCKNLESKINQLKGDVIGKLTLSDGTNFGTLTGSTPNQRIIISLESSIFNLILLNDDFNGDVVGEIKNPTSSKIIGEFTGNFTGRKGGNISIDIFGKFIEEKINDKGETVISITATFKVQKIFMLAENMEIVFPKPSLVDVESDFTFTSISDYERLKLEKLNSELSPLIIEELPNLLYILYSTKENSRFFINSIPLIYNDYCNYFKDKHRKFVDIDPYDLVLFMNQIELKLPNIINQIKSLFIVPNNVVSNQYWFNYYKKSFLDYNVKIYYIKLIDEFVGSEKFKNYILTNFLPLMIKSINKYNSKEFTVLYESLDKIFVFFRLHFYNAIISNELFSTITNKIYKVLENEFTGNDIKHSVIAIETMLNDPDMSIQLGTAIKGIHESFKNPVTNKSHIVAIKKELEDLYFESYISQFAVKTLAEYLY